jgi:hypothetical protein
MADSDIDPLRKGVAALKTEDIFSGKFKVAKRRYTLTQEEEEARKDWNTKQETFRVDNLKVVNSLSRYVMNAEAIASSFLLPPKFGVHIVSGRRKVKEKWQTQNCPPTLREWDDFDTILMRPFDSTTELENIVVDPFNSSFDSHSVLSDEKGEEEWLNSHLWNKFVCAQMMSKKEQARKITGCCRNLVHGLPGISKAQLQAYQLLLKSRVAKTCFSRMSFKLLKRSTKRLSWIKT